MKHAQLEGQLIPWFDPAASVVNSSWARILTPAVVASIASIPEGGWWTQEKLYNAGLALDPFCRLCKHALGSLRHRLFRCPSRRQLIAAGCPSSLRSKAIEESDNPLFNLAVPLRPQCPDPPPRAEAWIGSPPRDGAIASGTAYTDGALKGTVPKARRGGWAFVVDDGHASLWGTFGTCAEPCTSVLRAELRALAEILRVSAGHLTVNVDNSQVVDGILLGRQWCCLPVTEPIYGTRSGT